MCPNWSENVFVVSKIKNTVSWKYVISDLDGEGIVGTFYEKEFHKTNQEEFRIKKKQLKEKEKSYTVNGKAIIICLIAGLIKKHFYKRIDTFLNHINLLEETLMSKLI